MSERIHPKGDGCPVDIQAREPLADGMPVLATASPSTAGFNDDMHKFCSKIMDKLNRLWYIL